MNKLNPENDREIQLVKQTLTEAADEIQSHWNDSKTLVNQRDQAQRSASVLRSKINDLAIVKQE